MKPGTPALFGAILVLAGCQATPVSPTAQPGPPAKSGIQFTEELDTDDYVADDLRRNTATNFFSRK